MFQPVVAGLILPALPYAMRMNGVGLRAGLTQSFLPALLPAIPMALVVYGLREMAQPASYLAIGGVAIAGRLLGLRRASGGAAGVQPGGR